MSKLLTAHSTVVDVDSIVGGTAARRSHVRDDARESHGTRVDTIFALIVVAQHLSSHLRNAIHGLRALNGVLRSTLMRGVLTKRTDAARGEHGAVVLAGHLQDVPQTVDANLPSQLRLRLGNHRQQGCQVVDGVDIVFLHHLGNAGTVGHIGQCRRTTVLQFALRLGTGDISGHHMFVTITCSEFACQFRTDLSC